MSRISVFSIVFALTVGPDAAAICDAWCAEGVIAAESCDHGTPELARIAAADCCDDQMPAVAVLQTALRFDASLLECVLSVSPASGPFADGSRLTRPHPLSGSRAAIDARPQTTILRI